MKNLFVFLMLIAVIAGCGKKVECRWAHPHTVLIGYDTAEVDTLIVYKTAHDDFGRILDSTLCAGYLPPDNPAGELEIRNLTSHFIYTSSASAIEQGWIICVPATSDTFRIRSTAWEARSAKSIYDEPEDCTSWVTEIELNGVRSPVYINKPDYNFYLKKG